MVDRFADLRKPLLNQAGDIGSGSLNDDGLEMAEKGQNSNPFMKEFFDEVGGIKAKIAAIKRNTAEVVKLHDKAMTAIMKKNDDDALLEDLMAKTNQLALEIKAKLGVMDRVNKSDQFKKLEAAEQKIRMNMYHTLVKQFMETMEEYQAKQEAYKAKVREKIERQIHIVKPGGVTEEQMDEYMQGKKQVFADVIVGSNAAEAYQDIQARHKEILKLEESLRELHQLFVDMAALIASQGELIDQIEAQVNMASEYVTKGTAELEQANKYQKSNRKKTCFIVICITVIVGIVVALAVSFSP